MAEETLNLYQKLAKIRSQIEVMQKSTKAFNYTYVSEEDLLAKVSALLKKYDLSLIPSIVPGSLRVESHNIAKTKLLKDKDGNQSPYEENVHECIASADMTWTWVNNANPEEQLVIPWVLVGQQADAAQAVGSGLTYNFRYFLLKFFNVATPKDDPDNWRGKQKEAELAEDKALAAKIIEEFDTTLKKFLADSPGDTDAVKKLIGKYVKNSNYFAITESALAAKLMEDFKKTFIKGE